MQTQRNGMIEAAEQAQDAMAETARTVRDTATNIGGKAQQYASEAGRQATAAAQTAYSTGNDMLGQVESLTRENVWPALLIAGAIGYGLACLVKATK
ncbi:MAG TPA: hypothetical protein VG651_05350 [Stellaceae bacterium]|nr:hypothetical protein [Stellaceae bacterium]